MLVAWCHLCWDGAFCAPPWIAFGISTIIAQTVDKRLAINHVHYFCIVFLGCLHTVWAFVLGGKLQMLFCFWLKVADFEKTDPCIVMDPPQWTEYSFALPAWLLCYHWMGSFSFEKIFGIALLKSKDVSKVIRSCCATCKYCGLDWWCLVLEQFDILHGFWCLYQLNFILNNVQASLIQLRNNIVWDVSHNFLFQGIVPSYTSEGNISWTTIHMLEHELDSSRKRVGCEQCLHTLLCRWYENFTWSTLLKIIYIKYIF